MVFQLNSKFIHFFSRGFQSFMIQKFLVDSRKLCSWTWANPKYRVSIASIISIVTIDDVQRHHLSLHQLPQLQGYFPYINWDRICVEKKITHQSYLVYYIFSIFHMFYFPQPFAVWNVLQDHMFYFPRILHFFQSLVLQTCVLSYIDIGDRC